MFATVVIVLPSSYTGGQVHVSHADSTETFDLALHSLTTICVLAWYTDVMHKAKPITSGYRLALTYNLIHISPGIPRPTLPTMHNAIAELPAVLRRWSEHQYPDCKLKVVAYLLAHRYSEVNLTMGALKGEDAHRISHLRPIAEELGYIIGLATLSSTNTNPADDCRGDRGNWDYLGRKRRRLHGHHDEDHLGKNVLTMEDVPDIYITNLVDLDGAKIVKIRPLSLSGESLIPAKPFNDEDYVCHSHSLSESHLTYKSPSSFTVWRRHSTM